MNAWKVENPAPVTAYQRRWLLRARLRNRLIWIAFAVIVFKVFFDMAGVALLVIDLTAACAFFVLLTSMLIIFLNSCPRCNKNFYSSGFRGSNAFTNRCMNCGLAWKDMR